MITSSRSRLVLITASAALTLSALTGCSILSSFTGQPIREDGEITEGSDADVFALRVGDCFNNEDGTESVEGEISSIPVVPCDEPHDNEAYYSFDLDDGDFPGASEVNDLAEEGCTDSFEDFVGVSFDESELYVSFITPTVESWATGDQEVLCVILQDGEQTTGTLEDANR